MFRLLRRGRYAFDIARAIQHIRAGRPRAAHANLTRAQRFAERRGGLLDAMLAYCCIGFDTGAAKAACERVFEAERPETPAQDRQYIVQYCRYLSAALANDYAKYVEERQKLKSMSCSRFVGDALRVDRLFVRDPSSGSIN